MKIASQSFTIRLTIVMTVLIAITLMLTIFLTVYSIEKALSDQIGESFELQAENLSALIELYLAEEVERLLILAESNTLQETVLVHNAAYEGQSKDILAQIRALNQTWVNALDTDPLIVDTLYPDPEINPIPDELRSFLEISESQTEVFVTDRHGATVGASARLSDYQQADELWWQSTWHNGEGAIYISSPEFDQSAGITALLIGVPIFSPNSREPIGVLRSTLSVDALLDLIATQQFGITGGAILVDYHTGTILNSQIKRFDTEPLSETMQTLLHQAPSGYFIHYPQQNYVEGDVNNSAIQDTGINTASLNNTDLLVGYTRVHIDIEENKWTTARQQTATALNNLGWLIVVHQNENEAFASIQSIFWQGGLVGLGAILFAGIAALLVTRTVTRPLIMLSRAAEEIGKGNLETPLPAVREDEIGRLTQSFAYMTDQLSKLINSLKTHTTELSNANKTLASEVMERKQTAKALQEERNLLQTLMDTLPDYIYIKDAQSRFIKINNAHLQGLGGTNQEDVIGKTDLDFAPTDLANQYLAEEQALIQSGQPLLNHIEAVRWHAEAGVQKWMLTTKIPLKNEDGSIRGLMGISRDITVLKERENELQEAMKRAESATQAKSQFLANMSHEIRTPMNAVIGMTSLLLDTSLNLEQQDFVETIRMSGDSLLTIINDILDFSKLESGQFELEIHSFNLAQCVKGAIDLFQVETMKKGLALTSHLDPQIPALILSDATRLRQILVNLLGNAIKFTEQGSVALRVTMQEGERTEAMSEKPNPSFLNTALSTSQGLVTLQFAITDTGIGISPAHQNRLFKSFSQADTSMTRRYGGTGLGLAISKQLCEMMGGTMWVESDVGIGSTFYFTINIQPVLTAKAQSNGHHANGHHANGYHSNDQASVTSAISVKPVQKKSAFTPIAADHPLRILLAEDNLVNQKVATRILDRLGYRIDIAANGKEAVESLHRQSYDVILMDVHMPEMDGLQATYAIRQQISAENQPYVIAMTADAMQGDREKCMAAGMDDYVSKPVRVDELIGALKRTPIQDERGSA